MERTRVSYANVGMIDTDANGNCLRNRNGTKDGTEGRELGKEFRRGLSKLAILPSRRRRGGQSVKWQLAAVYRRRSASWPGPREMHRPEDPHPIGSSIGSAIGYIGYTVFPYRLRYWPLRTRLRLSFLRKMT